MTLQPVQTRSRLHHRKTSGLKNVVDVFRLKYGENQTNGWEVKKSLFHSVFIFFFFFPQDMGAALISLLLFLSLQVNCLYDELSVEVDKQVGQTHSYSGEASNVFKFCWEYCVCTHIYPEVCQSNHYLTRF